MEARMKPVQWDHPGRASVQDYYAGDPNHNAASTRGSILSARFHGMIVRVAVDLHQDGVSYGKVAAIIDPDGGKRQSSFDGLAVGDRVSLPDHLRAFEPEIRNQDR